ncbi:hypothetical protein [Desulfovibrio piger]|uniref:hypothetical protein n=1 Tax=Desulfovibrio piger TaxID=901 RepID=UPI0026651C4F|nr:hypothetical protein [Desulfovibrio piger]
MALVLCPECKREISSEAGTCPRCGYHITSSRSRFWAKLFWFLFVLFNVLMLLYALFNIGPMITHGIIPSWAGRIVSFLKQG